ncbi:hypothetical protein VYU27_004887 [Nannochloropsis oceanica]
MTGAVIPVAQLLSLPFLFLLLAEGSPLPSAAFVLPALSQAKRPRPPSRPFSSDALIKHARFIFVSSSPASSLLSFPHSSSCPSFLSPKDNTDTDTDDDAAIIARTCAWIHNMVIRTPLCPFAEKVIKDDTVKYVVTRVRKRKEVAVLVLEEALALIGVPETETATTVLIAPYAFVEDFPAFYETERFLEDHLEESPLGEEVLVASFHPQYMFGGGVKDDDPIHYEKRSPYPVFNLLRAQRVWAYADEGLTEKIADKNAEALEELGIKEVRRRFALDKIEVEGEGII